MMGSPKACSAVLFLALVAVAAITACSFAAAAPSAGQADGTIRIPLPESDVVVWTDAEGFCRFTGTGLQYISQTGEPSVPCQWIRVLLPPDAGMATVKAAVNGYRWTAIDGEWDVPPVAALVAGDAESTCAASPTDEAAVNVRDAGIYETDALFPTEPVVKVDVQVYRGWKMAQVFYAPYAYNPVDSQIYRLSGTAIEVTFDAASLEAGSTSADVTAADQVSEMTVNFAQMSGEYGGYAVSADSGRYVVITTSAIQTASTKLADFVESKKARGFTVQVVTEGTWGGGTGDDAADNIRSWLRANYVTLDIEYVLLIGNPHPSSGTVPMKMCYPQDADSRYLDCPTDFYYAELTEDWDTDSDGKYGEYDEDFSGVAPRVAEVAVGRIPYYGSITELDHILSKIIAYETQPDADLSWRRHVLLPMKPSDPTTPGYQLGEEIKATILAPNGWTYHRVYEDEYGLYPEPESTPCTIANVANAWQVSDPNGAVFWWTHGSETEAEYVMNLTAAATLDDSHPAFAFQCSCLNGSPETTTNLGYSLLKNGCIATVSASRVSWYDKGQTSFAGTPTNSGMTFEYASRMIAGEMYAGDALVDLKADIPPYDEVLWMNYLDFNLYGDPALGLYTPPLVQTNAASELTTTSATVNARLESLGTGESATVSFDWGTMSGGPYTDTDNRTLTGSSYFSFDLDSLHPGTTYYYRAKGVGWGTGYGQERSFTTLTEPPSLTTVGTENVTTTSAVLWGNLGDLGTADGVVVYFTYGTASGGPYPDSTDNQTLTAPGDFSVALGGLEAGTTYYFVAMADGDGSDQGEELNFTTLTIPPSVTTNAAGNVTATSARLNGNLADLGTADNVTVSFGYGTAQGGPYTWEAVGVKYGTGTFFYDLSGLKGKTKYYFTAMAVGDGTGYGYELDFTTLPIAPSVTTEDASVDTPGQARLNGRLEGKGTATSVAVSFLWGYSSGSYSRETVPATVMPGAGDFYFDLDHLPLDTVIYYQAKAVGDGEARGAEMSFNTGYVSPTVVTNPATDVTPTSAVLHGNLTSKGTAAAVTVSFEWWTELGSYTPVGGEERSDIGDFSVPVTGLAPGTMYYFRAKASGEGTHWGEPMSFTTPLQPPVVTGVAPSSGKMGQRLIVIIAGTAMTGATGVSFGPDVTVERLTVLSPTQIEVVVLTTCDATAGSRNVAVTTPGGTDTLENGFTVSDAAPNKPVNVAPSHNASVMTLTPTLGSSEFSHPCPSRTHSASQWQVKTASGDYTSAVFDSGADTANLTSIVLPEGTMDEHTNYYWHVRHRDDRGVWSAWSAETVFIRIDFLSGALEGPAAIRATDSSSRVTGVVDSQTEEQIPLSHYLDGTVTIISPGDSYDSYVWEVVGTADGSYTLTITKMVEAQSVAFHAVEVPVAAGEVHRYVINWGDLAQGRQGVTIEIDAEGDGIFDRSVVVGAEVGSDVFGSGTSRGGMPKWAWALVAISVVAGLASILVLWRMDRSKRRSSAVPPQ